MLIDRTHRKWFFVSAIIFAVATAGYVVYASRMPNGPRGGSVVGLIFGIVGSLMMTFAGLFAGRKQFPIAEIPIPLTGIRLRLGSAQFWLRGHIWLGLLSVPMILFHSGFAWGGPVEKALWITFGVVVASGLYGLVVQQVFPRFLTSRVPMETFVQQIPYQCTRTKILSDRLVAEVCGALDVRDDPLFPVFARVSEFYNAASKDDKDKWIDVVGDENRSLFLGLATHAKQSRLIRMEADFAKFLQDVYAGLSSGGAARPAAARRAGTPAAAQQPADSDTADAPPTPTPSPSPSPKAAKASPLEQMRARAAGGAKPASPLERARAQAGAETGVETIDAPIPGNGDPAAEAPGRSAKPASKLEQARAAARKQADEGAKPAPHERGRPAGPATGAGGKPLSKLEQARLAATHKADAPPAPDAAASSAAVKEPPAASPAAAPSARPSAAPKANNAAPARAEQQPMPAEQVDQEVGRIRDLLRNEYGYDDERANFAAEQPRQFLAPQTAKPPEPEYPRAKPAKSRHRASLPGSRSMTVSDFVDCVELACPFCEFEVQLRERSFLGRPARCPNCREKFLLVEPDDEDAAAPEPAAARANASPLERARAQGAKESAPAAGQKLSPLERARAQAAAKQGEAPAPPPPAASPAAPTSAAPSGKKSPLDRAREQAAAKAGDKPAPASADSPPAAAKAASPLEKVRAQAAARGQPADAKSKPAGKPPAGKPMPGVAQKKPAAASKPAASKPGASKPGAKSAAPVGPIPRTDDLKAFYLNDVRPFLDVRSRIEGQLATTDMASRVFTQMRVELPTELHPILGELEQNCEQRRQFAVQKRIHRWLHCWLAFHIPASAALFVLFVIHVVTALRVTPWAM
ncbi:MAG TPA: hypothetical protein VML55_17800 [Planctomycetaceae bacterium]|nr:hypothetical protein [Planctomycetaceae bacterium]